MKIKSIIKNSIAEKEGFKRGDILLKINNRKVKDIIDYEYLSSDEIINIEVERNGKIYFTSVTKETDRDLGLIFETEVYRRCHNKCVFCFIDQNPPGLRKSLYFKDEDYRLSLLYGNYITMSNLNKKDIERIISLRLSPLYVSIHATDPEVRKAMLGRKKDDNFLGKLVQLIENNIQIHGQIVLCPGINDGEILQNTINELHNFFPGIKTIAIVPVGLTKYRTHLPEIAPVAKKTAAIIINEISILQENFTKKTGEKFVYLSDEFYILAGQELPQYEEYGDFWQIENGVGMARNLINIFETEKDSFPERLPEYKKILIITGKLFFPVLSENILPVVNKIENLKVRLLDVENNLFGKSVTVSGLLGGLDITEALKNENEDYDLIVLPPDCTNDDNIFLDDITFDDLNKQFHNKIVLFKDSFLELFKLQN